MLPCKLIMNNKSFFLVGNQDNLRRRTIIYTIIENCKFIGINVFEYHICVFIRELQPEEMHGMFLLNR